MFVECYKCNKQKNIEEFPPSNKSWCTDCHTQYYRLKNSVKNPRIKDIDGQRKCSKCEIIKPIEMFTKNKTCLNGYERKCRNCSQLSRKTPEQIANQKRLSAKWYQENKELQSERSKSNYLENKNHILDYQRSYYQNNKIHIKQRVAAWNANNLEKRTQYTHRRRLWAIRNGNNDLTAEQIETLKVSHPYCKLCNATDNLTLDHNLPLSRGGQNTLSNIIILCGSCNSSKSDRTLDEYNEQRNLSL